MNSRQPFTAGSGPEPDAGPAHRIHSVIDLWLGEQLRRRRKAMG